MQMVRTSLKKYFSITPIYEPKNSHLIICINIVASPLLGLRNGNEMIIFIKLLIINSFLLETNKNCNYLGVCICKC